MTQGRAGVSDQEINEILELTRSKQFVESLPKGLDSDIGDKGNALSGGQKARLDFARALVLKPKILILDEVTGQLDVETKQHIATAVDKLRKEITIIVVSHDNELAEIANCIYEFQGNLLTQKATITAKALPSE